MDLTADATPRQDWPVFLIGCHRSGTTLLRYILNAHPRLICPPESKFIAGFEALLKYPQVLTALQSLDCETSDVFSLLRQFAVQVMGGYTAKHGKARWVDKTPNYYRQLPLIESTFARKVLYLFMLRHPLDCVVSMDEAPYFKPHTVTDPDVGRAIRAHGYSRASLVSYWQEVNSTLVSFECDRDRVLIVRYEDLVRNPEQIVEQILAFLDEEQVSGLHTRAFGGPRTPGYQDWKIHDTTMVHTDSIARFRSWGDQEIATTWRRVEGLARTLGYSADAPFVEHIDSEILRHECAVPSC
jgi:sulfotransferase family protein